MARAHGSSLEDTYALANSSYTRFGCWCFVMKTRTFPKVSSKWLIPFTHGRMVLLLLLTGHLICALSIWFAHNPGLQSWTVLPIINGFVTFWLLAKPQTPFLSWNE